MKTLLAPLRLFRVSAPLLLVTSLLPIRGQAGSFSTDFNSGPPSGATAYGNALVDASGGVGDSGVLKLTPAAFNQQGSFIVDDLDPAQRIDGFNVAFNLRMGGGTSTPGDGMSFCFATDLPNSDFNENGAGSGLVISFDTFENGPPWDNLEGPEIRLYYNNAILDHRKISNQFRTDTSFVPVSISYTPSGTLTLVYNGVVMYTNFFVFGPTPSGARFGFGARCGGGANETHYIDDLNITTTPVSRFYVKGSITPSPASEASPATPFQVVLQDSGATVKTGSVLMSFNGASVTPSVSKVGAVTTISHQPLLPLPASSINHVKVSFGYINDPATDTLTYDFTVARAPFWSLAPTSRSYLPLDTDAAGGSTPLYRGIAYNSLSNHLYIISRTGPNAGLTINVLDAKTGADLFQLNTNGIGPSGTIIMAFMSVADDGALYATSIGVTNGVTIYKWDNGNSATVPKVVFAGVLFPTAPSNTRWGDALAVRGAGASTQLILDAGGGFTNAAILTATDSFATNFTSTGYVHSYPSANAIGRTIQFGPTNTYFIKRRSTTLNPPAPARALQFNRYDTSPNTTLLLSDPDFYAQVGLVTLDLAKNLAAGIMFVTNAATPDRLIVYDVSNLSSPLQIAEYNFPTTHQKNNNFIGQVVFSADRIFALNGNNGVIAVPASPTFQPGLAITHSNNSVILSWIASTPEFVLQSSPTLVPPAWASAGLPVISTGGQNFVTNTIGGTAKFYRLSSP